MTSANPLLASWLYLAPNFILAALMYTLLGRLVLGLFVRQDWDNYIWRGFTTLTDPVVRVVRFVTPQILSHTVVLMFAALWLMALRVAYMIILLNIGLAPVANQAS